MSATKKARYDEQKQDFTDIRHALKEKLVLLVFGSKPQKRIPSRQAQQQPKPQPTPACGLSVDSSWVEILLQLDADVLKKDMPRTRQYLKTYYQTSDRNNREANDRQLFNAVKAAFGEPVDIVRLRDVEQQTCEEIVELLRDYQVSPETQNEHASPMEKLLLSSVRPPDCVPANNKRSAKRAKQRPLKSDACDIDALFSLCRKRDRERENAVISAVADKPWTLISFLSDCLQTVILNSVHEVMSLAEGSPKLMTS